MPTFERLPRFDRDWSELSPDQRARFREAVRAFIDDLDRPAFRAGLRVKGIQGAPGVFEMTWAPDGRATFSYGPDLGHGHRIVWRRIGSHAVLRRP